MREILPEHRRSLRRADAPVCPKFVTRALLPDVHRGTSGQKCPLYLALLFLALLFQQSAKADSPLEWSNLKPLPDEHGYAGAFAGVSNGALIVAGGANFPDGFPWEGGAKAWHDSIFVLEKPDGEWKKLDQVLPYPVAYGVSVGEYFIGGQDADKSFAKGMRISYSPGKLI